MEHPLSNLKLIKVKQRLRNANQFQKLTGVVLVLIVAAIGTYIITHSYAASPYVSTTAGSGTVTSPAVTQNCTGASDENCVVFGSGSKSSQASGIYDFTPGTDPMQQITDLNNSPFKPQGIDWLISWFSLETESGMYNWPVIDDAINDASNAGYKSIITILPGKSEPSWLLTGAPTITVPGNGPYDSSTTFTIANPVSPQYLSYLDAMIAEVGTHYNGNPNVTEFQGTGLGLQGEMELGMPQPDWASEGISDTSLLAGWEQTEDAWRAAFPNTPTALAIDNIPSSTDSIVPSLMTHLQKYGDMMWYQQNGLDANFYQHTTTGYGATLTAASAYTNVGWQMLGSGTVNGNFADALLAAQATNSCYLEVYQVDILDAANTVALNNFADQAKCK